ncbi:MAG: NAD(P)-dependent oxidoreductase, partial [Bacteroidales bacterium]|nr:NAD(P)-dependent oxidoreductase [Bacteroidales bacterium]
AADKDFDRINNVYTRNLIDALKNSGNTPEKFVFMSSMSAFGPGDEINYTPLNQNDTPKPNTAYGRSKIHAEQYLQSQTDFPYIILRPTGVYGPREKDYLVMVRMVNAGFDVAVGLKPQHLSFIYVKDLTKICFAAIESPLKNKVWFVADGDVYTSQEYTEIVKKALQKKHVLKI